MDLSPEGTCMYFILIYEVVDDFINRRAPFRPQHLKLVEDAHRRGELVMAGAFSDPVDGAALVFKGSDPIAARRFAETDPYVTNGLITQWRVRGWNVVVGG
ncbi:MAG TPA: YciI-like protein [Candidatus Binataceae bacterium]|nr:YciI-like protein [Candidatus Binataceae bacterium]